MSIVRHHAEWLALVEASGPFLSMPVLLRVFPQGLDAHDPDLARTLRLAFDEWEESQEGPRPETGIHQTWVRWVLTEVLGLPKETFTEGQAIAPGLRVTGREHGESLAPDLVVTTLPDPSGAGGARVLVHVWPRRQDLARPVPGRHWSASAETRMAELLRLTGVTLGLVTNGEHWMLVNALADQTTGVASWYASLWLEERLTLQAFRSLLGAQRLFGVALADRLEALLVESAAAQQEVTDQLGYQVRRAVEVLVHALDRADRDRGGALLGDVSEARLYEAAVTIMMRLVFLFAAEERGLLPSGDDLYQQHYAVSTMRPRLREAATEHGEEVLERRTDAWCRLLATFRAVHGGLRHDRLTLPAYGGGLFDPDRFPFLEGRAAGTTWRAAASRPLPVDNRTVLHLLEALQLLRVAGGGPAEARRLSFKALDIEQIGHVYEGLLDHTARRADAPVVGLAGTREREPEVRLDELERRWAADEGTLVEFVEEETGRSESAVRNRLRYEPVGEDAHRLLVSCDNDAELERRVRPFAGLVREDSFGYPLVIREGSVYVTQGSDRRSTGTHYTPRSLTEPLVRHALDPLAYEGAAEGRPPEAWRLRSARDLLALRVCDLAMGSGAFLVQACRYLADRLMEAWSRAEGDHPGAPGITPEGAASTGAVGERLIPADLEERVALARRLVADRCLYGVDKNPLAVEMAKLSLWLITLRKDRPFTFLDHALRCGDSLLGVTSLAQLDSFHLDPAAGQQIPLWAQACRAAVASAVERRLRLESFTVENLRDAQEKARLLAEADAALADARLIGDLLIGGALTTAGKRPRALDDFLEDLSIPLGEALTASVPAEERARRLQALRERARDLLGTATRPDRVPFHWALEFPEVSGFGAITSNPPFQGGQKITGVLGTDYRNYLVRHLAGGKRGSADLCAYFFLRAARLLVERGGLAMLATNTIAQGDTREVGLEQLAAEGFTIPRAIPSRKWPGSANLEVAHVWVRRGTWAAEHVLDETPVPGITPFLTPPGAVSGKPYRLAANADKSFQGSIVLGMGFVLTPEEAQALMERNSRNRDVLFPYLNGEDLNSRSDQSPSRWVINFRNWPLRRGNFGQWQTAGDEKRAEWLRGGLVPDDYPEPVASDYPDCLSILEQRVKPEREQNKYSRSARLRWWLYERWREELYAAIAGMDRVLVRARIANQHAISWVPRGWIFNEKTVVFVGHSFCALQGSIHEVWAREYSSSLRKDMQYTPSDCFETFPFSLAEPSTVESLGARYEDLRRSIMADWCEGLTKTYNRFHSPAEMTDTIVALRTLHAEMDHTTAGVYGWSDIDLDHSFHATRQGVRFTISENARREVLGRLLTLNHERYAEEVRRGLHDRKRRRSAGDDDNTDST